jgi:N-acyl-D-amino-acid deacylase
VFDLLIRGADVLDGTGSPAVRADLALQDGRIAAIGAIPLDAQAAEVIQAEGLSLAPGFIDIHTHADIALLARPQHLPKIMQGVTTEVFTNCGLGFAPCTPDGLAIQREYLGGIFGDDEGVDWGWRTVADFLARYEKQGSGTNIAYLIPHGAVRVSVMGMEARPATAGERERMEAMVREGMEQGAWGLSTGLWYAPMCHADRVENVAVCRAAALFATHQRSYDSDIFAATEETLAIAEEAGVSVQLSHLQLSGPDIVGHAAEVLELLDRARTRGVDVTWDSYPYAAGSTLVQALLPGWATDGGPESTLRRLHDPETVTRIESDLAASNRDWSRTVLAGARSTTNRPYESLSFREIAERRGLSVPAFVVRLVIEDELQACFIGHTQDERDVRLVLQHSAQMVGSDGLHLPGKTHPRLYGTFPRILGEYARDRRDITLAEAVRKMTSAPAARLGFKDRGTLEVGKAADLVLFDPSTVHDTATYEDPLRFPEGIPHVWVNGIAVKRDNQPTGALPGQILRKNG